MVEPLAHSHGHLLLDHLQAVAGLAGDFSGAFDAACQFGIEKINL